VYDVCLIVDANVRNLLADPASAVNAWLNGQRGDPRLVAGGKLLDELAGKNEVRRRLVELDRAGLLRRIDRDDLRQAETDLQTEGRFVSDDPHVLALAIVSGARTLATNDDELIRDFKNKALIDRPRGSVYQDLAAHRPLLRHTYSCGIQSSESRGRRH
jgi:hypothetical protein